MKMGTHGHGRLDLLLLADSRNVSCDILKKGDDEEDHKNTSVTSTFTQNPLALRASESRGQDITR